MSHPVLALIAASLRNEINSGSNHGADNRTVCLMFSKRCRASPRNHWASASLLVFGFAGSCKDNSGKFRMAAANLRECRPEIRSAVCGEMPADPPGYEGNPQNLQPALVAIADAETNQAPLLKSPQRCDRFPLSTDETKAGVSGASVRVSYQLRRWPRNFESLQPQ